MFILNCLASDVFRSDTEATQNRVYLVEHFHWRTPVQYISDIIVSGLTDTRLAALKEEKLVQVEFLLFLNCLGSAKTNQMRRTIYPSLPPENCSQSLNERCVWAWKASWERLEIMNNARTLVFLNDVA